MNPENNYLIVRELAGKKAVVSTSSEAVIVKLLSAGFSKTENGFVKEIQDDEQRVSLINWLIDIDALFSFGKEWNPDELLSYYNEIGKLNRSYKAIVWSNPNEFKIYDRGVPS